MILPIFLTGLGCSKEPCVFCDQSVATSKTAVSSNDCIKERIRESFEDYLKTKDKKDIDYPLEIAFYGASFTALDFSYQKELLRYVQELFEEYTDKSHKDSMTVRISTRPDRIKKQELLDLKIRFNLGLLEIGVQSMNNKVLALANRGHTKQDVVRATRDLNKIELPFSCHQMIGLPGSSFADEINTAVEIVKLKPKYARVHPTLVLKGTELEAMYNRGEYKPLELDQAVDITEKVIRVYRMAGVKIIRLSLHPSELLLDNIVSGPWHPSFRELVESRYMMREAVAGLSDYEGQRVNLTIAPQDETYIRGENNSNYKALIDSFKLKKVSIVKDPSMERGKVNVSLDELN